MANKHRDIDPIELTRLAEKYCDECIESTKEVATGSGKIVELKERHLPTINYFLMHYLRREHFDFYKRTNFYEAIKNESHPLSNTIKSIDESFKCLAKDIVANEGKGIFYAKNALGMHDKQHIENKTVEKFDFDE